MTRYVLFISTLIQLLYLLGSLKMDEQEIAECEYLNREAVAYAGPDSVASSGSSGGNKSIGFWRSENSVGHGSMAASLLNSVTNSLSGRTSKHPDTLNITTLLCSNQYTTDGRSSNGGALFC